MLVAKCLPKTLAEGNLLIVLRLTEQELREMFDEVHIARVLLDANALQNHTSRVWPRHPSATVSLVF